MRINNELFQRTEKIEDIESLFLEARQTNSIENAGNL